MTLYSAIYELSSVLVLFIIAAAAIREFYSMDESAASFALHHKNISNALKYNTKSENTLFKRDEQTIKET